MHPRVCGGSVVRPHDEADEAGASPRVRGKRGAGESGAARAGCIPACAGEALGGCHHAILLRVHPRVCGGSAGRKRARGAQRGASPRVRGKQTDRVVGTVTQGCIPACAGEAQGRPRAPRRQGVHPRVCGEAIRTGAYRSTSRVHPRVCGGSVHQPPREIRWSGASPRVRGKRGDGGVVQAAVGCIPACAGEARRSAARRAAAWVHPRVCGGSRRRCGSGADLWGASPRVRGKLALRGGQREGAGCIPACAGEAIERGGDHALGKVHPRVCGGSYRSRGGSSRAPGASPRVRGKPRPAPVTGGAPGCIPACAGEAPWQAPRLPAQGVHPRVCGGSDRSTPPSICMRGASPRVRGKRRGPDALRHVLGCIPACAGEATPRRSTRNTTAVHPRVCGGSSRTSPTRRAKGGASPRVRGKHDAGGPLAPAERCIPACAGEAVWWPFRPVWWPVHPRVCGGSRMLRFTVRRPRGASPRVRGKRGGGGD